MKRILLATLAGIVAFSFVPVSVTGSVYVVTNGMNTIAMPMTEVKAYNTKDFNAALEAKKTEYLKQCSHLPAQDYMEELELRAIKEGPETVATFLDYRDKIATCSGSSFVSSAEYLTPVAIAITNISGEFELKINRFGDVVLVADGKRVVAGGEERYTWLTRFAPSVVSLTDTVELNNNNEISSTTLVDLAL